MAELAQNKGNVLGIKTKKSNPSPQTQPQSNKIDSHNLKEWCIELVFVLELFGGLISHIGLISNTWQMGDRAQAGWILI